jgi:hypothetical protein
MTLLLFGPDHAWQRFRDDQPIVSGRHPLHLYHGFLGSRSFLERGTLCCYDPAFQAGYPKTPVFDSGSRPAELFLTLAGGAYRPAAYKTGLALCCLLVPVFFAAAARWAGFDGLCVLLITAAGLMVWWGTPCRSALQAGDLDLLLASLAAVAHTALLVRFHGAPGGGGWLGLVAVGCLGWFSQPALFAGLFLLDLIYYLSVGARHRLGWHFALWSGLAGGVVVNAFWLLDWGTYFWIRAPLHPAGALLSQRTLRTLWEAPLWGTAMDRSITIALFSVAALGIFLWNQTKDRPAARLWGLGAGGCLALAVAGVAWETPGRFGTDRLLVPALAFAVFPAVHALRAGFGLLGRWTGTSARAAVVAGGVLAVPFLTTPGLGHALARHYAGTPPLTIGLGPTRQALVETLVTQTHPGARILWEDRPGRADASRWTTLLPLLTGRAYLGGLDPDASVEHAYASLADQKLAGRPLAEWTDAELEAFGRRYNVGWVVCWSAAAKARFDAWPAARRTVGLQDEETGCLYTLPPRSFVLQGQARLVHADSHHLALADVRPVDGKVVLSFHYQAGLQAHPGRVKVEREPDPYDPIAFIRLSMPGPVSRVTLTWEHR